MRFFYEHKGDSVMACYGRCLDFGAHLHNHIELVYMFKGCAKAFVDSKECIIRTGDAFLVFPNQIHQYKKIGEEDYFVSIFPPELVPEFHRIFTSMLPESPLIKHAGKNRTVPLLVRAIFEAKQKETIFKESIIKGYYLALLGELFQMTELEKIKGPDGNTIKTVLNYCMDNYTNPLRLDTIAKALHINRYYLSHLFSQKLRMGFTEYIGMLRISEACRLLVLQDNSITEIAYGAGFNSVRSFNRLFQKYLMMTPREYRKKYMVNPL